MDSLVADYIQFLYNTHSPKYKAANLISGLQCLQPQLKGSLLASWRSLAGWQRLEPPQRAPPLPASALPAVCLFLLMRNSVRHTLAVWTCFHVYLRPGELCDLRSRDILGSPTRALLCLRHTTTGRGLDQFVIVRSQPLSLLLWQLKLLTPPWGALFALAPATLRVAFLASLRALGMNSPKYRLYSLRRGGATHHFCLTGSFDSVMETGRWLSQRVCRLYIQEGSADLAASLIPPAVLEFTAAAKPLLARLCAAALRAG